MAGHASEQPKKRL